MAGPAEELDVAGVPVRLSNPGKIYFPELGAVGGTKRNLVEYYRTVALPDTGGDPAAERSDDGVGPLVRALRHRPTYLQRFPDGIDPQPGTSFPQARAVALDIIRPLLDEFGYRGFPKTSGAAASTATCRSTRGGRSCRCAGRRSPWPARSSAGRTNGPSVIGRVRAVTDIDYLALVVQQWQQTLTTPG
jgi:hypothetical protein